MKPASDKPRLITYPQLLTHYGEPRSRWTLHRLIKAGKFPAAKQLSDNRIAWDSRALDAHYSALPDNLAKA
jgi:predicted DNA-binding transcriptional regulator AlpA